MLKPDFRRSAAAVRAAIPADFRAAAALDLAQHGLALLADRALRSVAGYWPIRSEIDPRPLMSALGLLSALPIIDGPGLPLRFRTWRPGDPVQPGRLGTSEPGPDAAELVPDLVLVPLLAFDRRRHRLGYGAGFYDRTLAALRANGPVLAVGVAFAAQEVPDVPIDSWDEPLDLVLTEQGVV
jgi:5-formyltetrahydrofolate cyclo-ligase